MKFNIRLLYLYLFSFIGLMVAVVGSIQLVDLAIKVYVFKGADRYENPYPPSFDVTGKPVPMTDKEKEDQKRRQELETTRQRQRQASVAIAMLLVGIPLYKYHWTLIKKDK